MIGFPPACPVECGGPANGGGLRGNDKKLKLSKIKNKITEKTIPQLSFMVSPAKRERVLSSVSGGETSEESKAKSNIPRFHL